MIKEYTYNVEELVIVLLVLVHGRNVAGLLVPLAVVVVRHHAGENQSQYLSHMTDYTCK